MRGHHTVEDSLQLAAGIFKKQNIAQGSRHSVQGVGLFSFFLSQHRALFINSTNFMPHCFFEF
jgi:hypothetical protein